MRGMGRLWQAAGTVNAVLAPNLLEQRKFQNLRRDYGEAIRRVHGLGVMISSFARSAPA